jgi:signal transduction histidine kinase
MGERATLISSNTSDVSALDSEDPLVSQSARALGHMLLDGEGHDVMLTLEGDVYFAGVTTLQAEFKLTIVTLLPRRDYFAEIDQSRFFTVCILSCAMILWVLLFSVLVYSRWWLQGREDEHVRSAEYESNLHATKQRLLAQLSHELRTPLSGIVGLLDVLESECVQPEQKAHVMMLKKTCADLMQLLDGMLVLAKTEAGKSNVESNQFDLHGELEQVVANLRLMVSLRDVQVVCKYDGSLPDEFVGDRRKLRQIIDNLVSNAYKFTEAGTISIKVAKREQDAGAGSIYLDFWVDDTGTGILESREESIFDEFVQGDLGIRAVHGGSGLGLSIVRSLSRLMGGDVELAHTSQEGSSFRFWIRLGVCGPMTSTWHACGDFEAFSTSAE